MANNKDDVTKNDSFNFNELTNDIDAPVTIPPTDKTALVTKQRKPVDVKKGKHKEVIDKVITPTNKQIAREFGMEKDKANQSNKNALSESNKLKELALSNISASISQEKTFTRMWAPKVLSMLPSNIYGKLSLTDNSGRAKKNASEQIVKLLSDQRHLNIDQYVRNKSHEMIQDRVEQSRHSEKTTILSKIQNLTQRNHTFFEGTLRKYLMTSLDLKFKHIFVTKEILKYTKLMHADTSVKLDAVTHNTALDEMSKTDILQDAMKVIQQKVLSMATDHISTKIGTFAQKKIIDPVAEWGEKKAWEVGDKIHKKFTKDPSTTLEEKVTAKSKALSEMFTLENLKKKLDSFRNPEGKFDFDHIIGKKDDEKRIEAIIRHVHTGVDKVKDLKPEDLKEALPDIVKFIADLPKHTKVVKISRIKKYLEGGQLRDAEQDYLDTVFDNVPKPVQQRLTKILGSSFFKDIDDKTVSKFLKDKVASVPGASKFGEFGGHLNKEAITKHYEELSKGEVGDSVRRFKEAPLTESVALAGKLGTTISKHANVASIKAHIKTLQENKHVVAAQNAATEQLDKALKNEHVVAAKTAVDTHVKKINENKHVIAAKKTINDNVTDLLNNEHVAPVVAAAKTVGRGIKVVKRKAGIIQHSRSRKAKSRQRRQDGIQNYVFDEHGNQVEYVPVVPSHTEAATSYLKELLHEVPKTDVVRSHVSKGVKIAQRKIGIIQHSRSRKAKSAQRRQAGIHNYTFDEHGNQVEYVPTTQDHIEAAKHVATMHVNRILNSESVKDAKKTIEANVQKVLDNKHVKSAQASVTAGTTAVQKHAGIASIKAHLNRVKTPSTEPANVTDTPVKSIKERMLDQARKLTLSDEQVVALKARVTKLQTQVQDFVKGKAEAIHSPLKGEHPKHEAGSHSPVVDELTHIKTLMQEHFHSVHESNTAKIHIANQILSRIGTHGVGGTAGVAGEEHPDEHIPAADMTWSQAMRKPVQLGKKVYQAGKRGVIAYGKGTAKFYKKLAGLGGRALSQIPKLATPISAIAGLARKHAPLVGAGIAKVFNLHKTPVGSIGKGALHITKSIGKELIKNRFVDVYRKDKVDGVDPLMKGLLIKKGHYTTANGSPIIDSYSIKSPVYDSETKQLVVTEDDLKAGLVDNKNNTLEAGIGSKLVSKALHIGKKIIGGYGAVLKGAAGIAGRAISNVAGFVGKHVPSLAGIGKFFKSIPGFSFGVDAKQMRKLITRHLLTLISMMRPITKHFDHTFKMPSFSDKDDSTDDKDTKKADKDAKKVAKDGKPKITASGKLKKALKEHLKKKLKAIPPKVKAGGGLLAAGAAGLAYLKNKFGKGGEAQAATDPNAPQDPNAPPTQPQEGGGSGLAGGALAATALAAGKSIVKGAWGVGKGIINGIASGGKWLAGKASGLKTAASAAAPFSVDEISKGIGTTPEETAKRMITKKAAKRAAAKAGTVAGSSLAAKAGIGSKLLSKSTPLANLYMGYQIGDYLGTKAHEKTMDVMGLKHADKTSMPSWKDLFTSTKDYFSGGRSKRQDVMSIRNEIYKVPKDKLNVLTSFENELGKALGSDGKTTLKPDDLKDYMEKFGLDKKDKEQFTFFKKWYTKQFFPIFSVSSDIILKEFNIPFVEQDKMTDDQVEAYRKKLESLPIYTELKSTAVELSLDACKKWALAGGNNTDLYGNPISKSDQKTAEDKAEADLPKGASKADIASARKNARPDPKMSAEQQKNANTAAARQMSTKNPNGVNRPQAMIPSAAGGAAAVAGAGAAATIGSSNLPPSGTDAVQQANPNVANKIKNDNQPGVTNDYTKPFKSKQSGSGKGASLMQIMEQFIGLGWTKEQASGLVGNIAKESGGNPSIVGDGGKAIGIVQWHPDRQRNFKAAFGKDIRESTVEEQVKFVDYELRKGTERGAGKRLLASKTASEAGAIVSKYYERPRDTAKEMIERGNNAEGFAKNYKGPSADSKEAIASTGGATPEAGKPGDTKPKAEVAAAGDTTADAGKADAGAKPEVASTPTPASAPTPATDNVSRTVAKTTAPKTPDKTPTPDQSVAAANPEDKKQTDLLIEQNNLLGKIVAILGDNKSGSSKDKETVASTTGGNSALGNGSDSKQIIGRLDGILTALQNTTNQTGSSAPNPDAAKSRDVGLSSRNAGIDVGRVS